MNKDKKIFLTIEIVLCVILIGLIVLFYFYPRVHYSYSEDTNTYCVSKVYGNARRYEVKNNINGIDVTFIDERAFQYKNNVEEVILPDTVSVIKKLAFSDCTNLRSINLDKVNSIERNAFSYCTNLNNIITKASIGGSVFYKCENLTSIDLLDGALSIGTMAFSYTSIEEISLPSTLRNVYIDAFKYSSKLKTINAYSSLSSNSYLLSIEDSIKINWR